MSDWQLGIDFGTSFTVVAVAQAGRVDVIDVESDGRARLPSAVFLNEDGEILVGTRAQHQAVFAPERFEPTPKRSIGEGDLFLGDELVPVADLIAGVFRRVYRETCRQQGETPPSAVMVTHPAGWADVRLQVLHRAVATAGLERVQFVAEPVAAAARIAMARTAPGERIAVYDFGGGTFDAAVLLRTPTGFEVAGPPTGRDPLGGEDIDRRIIDHVGALIADEHPDEWKKLMNPPDVSWRRDLTNLRSEVQQAKETLSETTSVQLFVAGVDQGIQLTRAELEDLIRKDIEETVDTLEEAITAAGTEASALAGIYLVGGSSRIPLVADTIWRRLGVVPTAQDNPKSVVAMGAAAWLQPVAEPASWPPPTETIPAPDRGPTADREPTPVPVQTRPEPTAGPVPEAPAPDQGPPAAPTGVSGFRPRLALPLDLIAGAPGAQLSATVNFERKGAGQVRIQGWPAAPGAVTGGLTAELGRFHATRTFGFQELSLTSVVAFGQRDGIERRFNATGPQGREGKVERYLVSGGQNLVATAPDYAAGALDHMNLQTPLLDPSRFFGLSMLVEHPGDVSVLERLQFTRGAVGHQMTVDHFTLPAGHDVASWLEHQVRSLLSATPHAGVVARAQGAIIEDLWGEVVTVRVADRRPMVATVGVADRGDELFVVTIWVPETDRGIVPALARSARIQPTAGA